MLQHKRGDTQSEKNCHNSLAVLTIIAIALHLPLIMAVITKKENVHNKCNTLVQNTLNQWSVFICKHVWEFFGRSFFKLLPLHAVYNCTVLKPFTFIGWIAVQATTLESGIWSSPSNASAWLFKKLPYFKIIKKKLQIISKLVNIGTNKSWKMS